MSSSIVKIMSVIEVDTNKFGNGVDNYAEQILMSAPRIVGNESEIDVFVRSLSGHNHTFVKDNKTFEYQTKIAITIIGWLYDISEIDVRRQYSKFLEYIESLGWFVLDIVDRIEKLQ